MAIVLGKKARVLIGASPAVVGNLVGSISYEVSDKLIDVTSYQSTSRVYQSADIKECALSFEAQFDAADAPQDALRAALVPGATALIPVALYPEGSTAGLVKFTGSLALESAKVVGADLEGVTTMSFSFKGAPLTEGTI